MLSNIENVGAYVDKIYVAYSELPWVYNPNARDLFRNRTNPDILNQSKYKNKIELITGEWKLEEDQRNYCLNAARKDGMDYLLTIDADEFYFFKDIEKIIHDIEANPEYDFYTTPWITFWKSFEYVISLQSGEIAKGFPEVAVNLRNPNQFIGKRRPGGEKIKQLDSLCHHASYVLSNQECWSKINTWGHTNDFNIDKWYLEKWLHWNRHTTQLHPIDKNAWYKAVKYNNELPEVIRDLKNEIIVKEYSYLDAIYDLLKPK